VLGPAVIGYSGLRCCRASATHECLRTAQHSHGAGFLTVDPRPCLVALVTLFPLSRIETLDPALIRPGRIDRKIEFPLPDAKTKRRIFSIHTSESGSSCQAPGQEGTWHRAGGPPPAQDSSHDRRSQRGLVL
jgi:hypothetical protein